MKHTTCVTALVLAASASAAPAAFGFDHLVGGERGTLKLEFELKGKEAGKAIHRTMVIQAELVATETTDAGPDDSVEAANATATRAARERADAGRDRRLAALNTRMTALEQKGLRAACDEDESSAACRSGTAEMRQILDEINAVMTGSVDVTSNKDRFQMWKSVQLASGKGCGTAEARVLDPGKPQQLAHLPSADYAAGVETCLNMMFADRQSGEAHIMLHGFEIAQPAIKERGYYILELSDIGDGAALRHLKFDPMQAHSTGSFSARGPRGITTVRWTFDRH